MSSLMSSRLDSLSEEPTSARHFSTLKKKKLEKYEYYYKIKAVSLETPPSLSVSVKSVAVLFHFSLARDRQMLYNSAQTHKQQHSEVNVRDWRDAQVWRLWNVNVINGQKALASVNSEGDWRKHVPQLQKTALLCSLSFELLLPSGAQMLDLILSVQRGDVEIYTSARVKSELQQTACRMKRLSWWSVSLWYAAC